MPELVASGIGTPPGVQEPSESSPSEPDLGESAGGAQEHSATADGNGKTPEKKALSRYERTKKERAAFKAEREVFTREREEFAKERAEFQEAQKPKRDYSLAELKKYRQAWEEEGKFDLVEKADAAIREMEEEEKASKSIVELPHAGTPEHEQQWHQAEAELYQADQEFMRSGTRLDTRLREIMGSADGEIYRQHPRGIIAAYHRAKMELLEGDFKELQTKFQKVEEENKRLNGLTSVGGGAPGRIGGGNRVESLGDFSKLSSADMRKHLKAGARGSSGTPWF